MMKSSFIKTLLLIGVFLLAIKWNDIYWFVNPPPDYSSASNQVVMYATSWCGYCSKARKFLNKVNVPFTEYDIEKSDEGRKQYQALGGGGVPILVVNGKIIRGYSSDQIIAYLEEAPDYALD